MSFYSGTHTENSEGRAHSFVSPTVKLSGTRNSLRHQILKALWSRPKRSTQVNLTHAPQRQNCLCTHCYGTALSRAWLRLDREIKGKSLSLYSCTVCSTNWVIKFLIKMETSFTCFSKWSSGRSVGAISSSVASAYHCVPFKMPPLFTY